MCGARALLTLSDLPPATSELVGSGRLEELMWSAAQRHSARPVVQGVCCEAIAAVTRERLRLAAAGALDLLSGEAEEDPPSPGKLERDKAAGLSSEC